MAHVIPDQHLHDLLRPLREAGWSDLAPATLVASADHPGELWQLGLRRSCMVLGVQLDPEPRRTETLTLLPLAAQLAQPDDGIGFFDAVNKPVTLAAVSHGLAPFAVEGFAAELGLLDPTRFRLPKKCSADERAAFLIRLYTTYLGGAAATWRGGSPLKALRALDADDQFGDLLQTAMAFGSGVIPDPVPMAAAIGITLDCWRHTELETAHAGSKTLTDVAMAKLNIGTTRAVRRYITTQGIDWNGVGGVLLDPERQACNDNRDSVGVLVGTDWPLVAHSIQQSLDEWLHAEQVAGPEATLRLASVMGSSTYTKRWWGNGWWSDFSDSVLRHVEETFPELLHLEADDLASRQLASDLFHRPDALPDTVLKTLIDPPDGQGLRYAPLPKLTVRTLHLLDQADRRGHRAA